MLIFIRLVVETRRYRRWGEGSNIQDWLSVVWMMWCGRVKWSVVENPLNVVYWFVFFLHSKREVGTCVVEHFILPISTSFILLSLFHLFHCIVFSTCPKQTDHDNHYTGGWKTKKRTNDEWIETVVRQCYVITLFTYIVVVYLLTLLW